MFCNHAVHFGNGAWVGTKTDTRNRLFDFRPVAGPGNGVHVEVRSTIAARITLVVGVKDDDIPCHTQINRLAAGSSPLGVSGEYLRSTADHHVSPISVHKGSIG